MPASIVVNGNPISYGGYELDMGKRKGAFWAIDSRRLSSVIPEAKLRISITKTFYSIRNVQQAKESSLRWDFDIVDV